jgi:hypothetical protein
MKGTIMSLIDTLENATDDEIVEASNKLSVRLIKKFIFGVVVSVAIHFASAFIAGAIEKKIGR